MHLQDVFQIGERVRCLVMGMDDNFTRISLSTAELEENEGDIMFEKVLPACPTVTPVFGVLLTMNLCCCVRSEMLAAEKRCACVRL